MVLFSGRTFLYIIQHHHTILMFFLTPPIFKFLFLKLTLKLMQKICYVLHLLVRVQKGYVVQVWQQDVRESISTLMILKNATLQWDREIYHVSNFLPTTTNINKLWKNDENLSCYHNQKYLHDTFFCRCFRRNRKQRMPYCADCDKSLF